MPGFLTGSCYFLSQFFLCSSSHYLLWDSSLDIGLEIPIWVMNIFKNEKDTSFTQITKIFRPTTHPSWLWSLEVTLLTECLYKAGIATRTILIYPKNEIN